VHILGEGHAVACPGAHHTTLSKISHSRSHRQR
jgi:hypothetical protein